MRVVLTGKGYLSGELVPRATWVRWCEENGILVGDRVGAGVTHLVASRSDTSKARDAAEWGVQTETYDWLLARINEGRASRGVTDRTMPVAQVVDALGNGVVSEAGWSDALRRTRVGDRYEVRRIVGGPYDYRWGILCDGEFLNTVDENFADRHNALRRARVLNEQHRRSEEAVSPLPPRSVYSIEFDAPRGRWWIVKDGERLSVEGSHRERTDAAVAARRLANRNNGTWREPAYVAPPPIYYLVGFRNVDTDAEEWIVHCEERPTQGTKRDRACSPTISLKSDAIKRAQSFAQEMHGTYAEDRIILPPPAKVRSLTTTGRRAMEWD